MLVLTWNLFHGRSVPDAPREQLADFAARLAGWEWDVALLQEVPPWWPPTLGRASEAIAEHRVRTLRAWPERRVVHGVRHERGWWVGNLHATEHSEPRAQADLDL